MLKLDDIQEKILFNHKKIVPSLKRAGQTKLADKISICGQYSQFATCKGCGAKYYVTTGGYCNSRFCSVCAKRRALAWLAKLMPLLEDYRKKGYKIFFLNLTIKDQQDLDIGLEALNRAWRIMTHDDKLSRRRFRELNDGGVRSVEVKLGAGSGIWHPHIHAITILKTDKVVKQYDKYRVLWEEATKNALMSDGKVGSVYIKGIRDNRTQECNDVSLMRGVVETFKYICKFEWLDLTPERLCELVKAVSGKHFIASWGELYGIKKQVEALLEESTEEELKHAVCKFCGCTEFELDNLFTTTQSANVNYFPSRTADFT